MARGQFVKLQCKANPAYNLSARSDGVVFAPADDSDPRQQWFKDNSWESKVKDEVGHPAFALVNKATHEALTHPGLEGSKVNVSTYFGHNQDESVLWTLSQDVGDGWSALRPFNNIHINLSTNHWDKKHRVITDGTDVILSTWKGEPNQSWRLIPLRGDEAFERNFEGNYSLERSWDNGRPLKIQCKLDARYNLSARSDGIVLAPADDSDHRQHWIKDDWWAAKKIDADGFPAFALLNRATQAALSHARGEGQQLILGNFNTGVLDSSILWTESQDFGHGWHTIRPAANMEMTLDALDGKKEGIHDGTPAVLLKWKRQDNQLWHFVPL
ncbi:hypothetical protein O6H91_18G005000 [Diphasiastrum complanatum]|uniref:Uncharacterized protein n=1 Tax=Diphasiastrum complanatum TaxID=34168 RepID=A0ACC2AXN3_DIPCM|nr:hypothetical protein O6H91_Y332600 [Diphasiastrum complanatum]KAJ7285455.1 hypothetical protein O6H91_Y332600 [Diphasiastrum complanatum]KAJ7285456.1 hypothetical protein O6H91_Y332600 [Diphasiastrum complanatum]KAJ7285457.1 hypothetical protein O6H91_Y332600 [Diphasiastrum complanatum]KAJ7285458.1 hypothetical protein O6H91_Y332600 [Diphasiastrum complanatum]